MRKSKLEVNLVAKTCQDSKAENRSDTITDNAHSE